MTGFEPQAFTTIAQEKPVIHHRAQGDERGGGEGAGVVNYFFFDSCNYLPECIRKGRRRNFSILSIGGRVADEQLKQIFNRKPASHL